MPDHTFTCPACGGRYAGRDGHEADACPSCGPPAEEPDVAEAEAEDSAGQSGPPEPPPGRPRRRKGRKGRSKTPGWVWGVVTVVVGLGGAVAWFGFLKGNGPGPSPDAPPAAGEVAGQRPGGGPAPPSPFAIDSEPRKMVAPPGPAPPEVADTVLLLPADHPVPSGLTPNLFDQELARQALGVVAREEFGLRVRDASLGEAAPDALPGGRQFRVRPVPNHVRGVAILVGLPGSEHQFWAGQLVGAQLSSPEQYLAEHERLASGFFAKCLTAAGLAARPARRSDAPVPADAEGALGRMREADQFAAVRRLHDEVRARGESDALVTGLARGYANLALLTEFHWGAAPYVYRARGLLYAHRLVARAPGSAAARRLRAYAAALAGWHALAVRDLDAAQKLVPDGPVPAWVEAAEHYVHFDLVKLRAARERADSHLLRVLEFRSLDAPEAEAATIRAGRAFLEADPECYLVHDAMCRTGGVSHLHRATVAGPVAFAGALADRVRAVPGLPAAVRAAADGPAPEPGVYAALRAAGRADRGEPSWAVLGGLLQDVRFAQAAHRLGFLADALSVDSREEAREFAEVLAGHRLRGLVESYTLNPRTALAEVRRGMTLPDGEADLRAAWYFTRLAKLDPAAAQARRFFAHASLYPEEAARVHMFRNDRTGAVAPYARQVLAASPHAPIGRAMAAAYGEPQTPAALAEAEARYADHAVVQWGLGQRHRAEGRRADAVRCWERWVELSPDGLAFRQLAELHHEGGDVGKWQETLEASLKVEDTGLHHAQARVDLARHFMKAKDFRRAEPYATAAATSGAGWALQCAAECQEGLGEWDAANDLYAAAAARYPDAVYSWYFACRQSGKMDRQAAERAVRAYLAAYGPGATAGHQYHAARFYLLVGEVKAARELFDQVNRVDPSESTLLFEALLADAAGDAAVRNRALDQFDRLPDGRNHVRPVGAAVRAWSRAATPPDAAAVEAELGRVAAEYRPDGEFYFGWYLHNRKLAARAAGLWDRCLAADAGTPWVKTHARAFAEAAAPKRD